MSNDELLEWLNFIIEQCDNNIAQGVNVEYWRGRKESYEHTRNKIVNSQTQDT